MTSRPENDLQTGTVGSGGTVADDLVDWLHQLNDFASQLPGALHAQVLTIASDAITPNRFFLILDTEGSAATDNLATINTTLLPVGSMICVQSTSEARKITLQHTASGTGKLNLHGGNNLQLAHPQMTVFLVLQSNGVWKEVIRSYGNQSAAMRAHLGLGAAAEQAVASNAQAVAGGPQLIDAARALVILRNATMMVSGNNAITPAASTWITGMLNAGTFGKFQLSAIKAIMNAPDHVETGLVLPDGSGKVSYSHGFSSEPSKVEYLIRCQTAEKDYSPGMAIDLQTGDTSSNSVSVTLGRSASEVFIVFPNNYPIRNYDSPYNQSAIDPDKWRAEFRLWR